MNLGKRGTLILLTVALTVPAITTARAAGAKRPAATPAPPAPVVVIVMENHVYGGIVGSPLAPYVNRTLIPAGRLFTDYHAVTHPSLPNYLAITSGNTHGCISDECVVGGFASDNVFHQLAVAGGTWRSYEESMPKPCYADRTGSYVREHNPALYFSDLNATCTTDDVAYPATLPAALADFTFVAPNRCDDMHSCSIKSGDTWLSSHVPALLVKGAEVIVTFDEGIGKNQRIMTVEAGAGVPAGTTDGDAYTHYSLLAGLERHFGLSLLGEAARVSALPV